MALADDARQLAAKLDPWVARVDDDGYEHSVCHICESDASTGHVRDCPTLSLPRIVAALEANVDTWARLQACYPEQAGRGGAAWTTRIHARNLDYDDALYLIELTHIARQGIAATATLETDAAR